MSMFKKMLAAGAAVTALGAAAPLTAQYYSQPYGYSQGYSQGYAQPYGYSQRYAQPYGYAQSNGYAQSYAYGANTTVAAQQCSAAVQSRLYNRSSIGGILGAVLGTSTSGRVLSVTQVSPRGDGLIRVRGLASSGRYASNGYGAYGAGAYGALGYGYANAADLSFRCDVAPNGSIYDVSIRRR